MVRSPGLNVRLKLTLSYAAFLMLAGILLLAVVWVFLLRYVPDREIIALGFVPNRSDLVRAFVPRVAAMLAFLVAFGLVGGWLLAGRMLAPLTRITDATRRAANGTICVRSSGTIVKREPAGSVATRGGRKRSAALRQGVPAAVGSAARTASRHIAATMRAASTGTRRCGSPRTYSM